MQDNAYATPDKMTMGSDTGQRTPSLPDSVMVKVVQLPEGVDFPIEQHPWGQFVYPRAGVIELTVKSNRYAAPPDFGVWLPPGTEHVARADGETSYFVLDIDADLCTRLPQRASILSVGAIAKAIFLDLQKRQVRKPQSPEDVRLMEVLIDQLSVSAPIDSFLPMSSDAALRKVLEALCKNPGDSRTLVEWARYVHSTERTLARRCTRDLGMTFLEWRQRLRLSRAFAMLADGLAVQVVAQKLGYGTTSAFIAMFQKTIGTTPNAFRAQVRDSAEPG